MSRWFSPPSRPRAVEGGIKARSKRGAIAQTWWSERFISVLESLGVGGRLDRGRNYARAGQVVDVPGSRRVGGEDQVGAGQALAQRVAAQPLAPVVGVDPQAGGELRGFPLSVPHHRHRAQQQGGAGPGSCSRW